MTVAWRNTTALGLDDSADRHVPQKTARRRRIFVREADHKALMIPLTEPWAKKFPMNGPEVVGMVVSQNQSAAEGLVDESPAPAILSFYEKGRPMPGGFSGALCPCPACRNGRTDRRAGARRLRRKGEAAYRSPGQFRAPRDRDGQRRPGGRLRRGSI